MTARSPAVLMRRWLVEGRAPAWSRTTRFCEETLDALSQERYPFIREFGFAVPTEETVAGIARYAPLVELGAGTGYLARLVAAAGADVVATDPYVGRGESYEFTVGAWYPVRRLRATTAIARFPERNVLVSWPCYLNPWCAEAAGVIAPGRHLIYLGETEGGCTANDRFFTLLDEAFVEVEALPMLRFPGLHDGATVYRRR